MMKVHSIFPSISGECGLIPQGEWAVIVRLDGCNLRCPFCDTAYTQKGNKHVLMSVPQITARVDEIRSQMAIENVLITGGEPLLQAPELETLLGDLRAETSGVLQVESNGSLSLGPLLYGADSWVMDYKLPSTGFTDKMRPLEEFAGLRLVDFVKFVIQNKTDYEEAKVVAKRIASLVKTNPGPRLVFSPALPDSSPAALYCAMRRDGLGNIQMSLQIHKLCSLPESDA